MAARHSASNSCSMHADNGGSTEAREETDIKRTGRLAEERRELGNALLGSTKGNLCPH